MKLSVSKYCNAADRKLRPRIFRDLVCNLEVAVPPSSASLSPLAASSYMVCARQAAVPSLAGGNVLCTWAVPNVIRSLQTLQKSVGIDEEVYGP